MEGRQRGGGGMTSVPAKPPHLGTILLAVHHLDLASYAYSQGRGVGNLIDAMAECQRCHEAIVAEAVRLGLLNTHRDAIERLRIARAVEVA